MSSKKNRITKWLVGLGSVIAIFAGIIPNAEKIILALKPYLTTTAQETKVEWQMITASRQGLTCLIKDDATLETDTATVPIFRNQCQRDLENRISKAYVELNGDTVNDAYYLVLANKDEETIKFEIQGSAAPIAIPNVKPREAVAVCLGIASVGGALPDTTPKNVSVLVKGADEKLLKKIRIGEPLTSGDGRRSSKCPVYSLYPPTEKA